jgi:formylglycine-generating enzyme required for sulfatase activity
MRTALQALRIGLGALALGAGPAAPGAVPVITNITMVGATPQFAVQSEVGITNQIQYSANLSQTNWVVLTNLLVAQSPYWFVDAAAPPASQRFYRVAALAAGATPPSGMALIPAGSFTMGNCMNPGEGSPDELPLHTNYVSAFCIDTNVVTGSLWTNVYEWATNHGYSFDDAGVYQAANHLAQTINWYDCVKWCNARSEMESLIPCYYTDGTLAKVYREEDLDLDANSVNWSANGYRLPTEAEWEKAARGGAVGHRFPWTDADTIDWSRANYDADPSDYSYDVNPTAGSNPAFTSGGDPDTSPVGSFAPNGYGLYDMAGNVWEWCWDWYDGGYYSLSPGTDPRGPASSPYGLRVVRGGSWGDYALYARCANRDDSLPTIASYYTGLRCVREH